MALRPFNRPAAPHSSAPVQTEKMLQAPAAHAVPMTFAANLTGAAEIPPVVSPGTGFATVVLDPTANTLHVDVTFSGLTSGTTASHIHCCVASTPAGNFIVATTTPTFPGFPLGVTSGTYDNTLDLTLASSYNPVFVADVGGVPQAEAALTTANRKRSQLSQYPHYQ